MNEVFVYGYIMNKSTNFLASYTTPFADIGLNKKMQESYTAVLIVKYMAVLYDPHGVIYIYIYTLLHRESGLSSEVGFSMN